MIDTAVQTVTEALNLYLKTEFNLSEDIVVLSNLLEQDGSAAPNLENKIAVFIVNVEKDTSRGPRQAVGQVASDRVDIGFEPVFINIYLIFACNFSGKNYGEALKFLSHTISFFQRHPVWDHRNAPDIDERIEKLCLDIVNLDIKDLSNLWGVISSKYIPSVIYKVRTFSFDSEALKERAFAVKERALTVKERALPVKEPARSVEN